MHLFTSESVSEGHPDKVADFISDTILDACLEQDSRSRVACETLCKGKHVALAGEITTQATLDYEDLVRGAVRQIGYTDTKEPFCSETLEVTSWITQQASEIAQGVDANGAGDQGIMFGYATDETPELMPLPILLAHRINQALAERRKDGTLPWLRPDSKTQVSVEYQEERPLRVGTVLVSTQHVPEIERSEITEILRIDLLPSVLGNWWTDGISLLVNPTGSFVHGGPSADAGLTGRKIIVDTYGGAARHGGGAFSGKDPTKVDRSAAYFCRFVARQIVQQQLARKAEIQVAYAIGVAEPVSIKVYTFATGDETAAEEFVGQFDFRPAAIIERLDLLRPIYRQTTNYGHFGRPGLPWED